MYGYIYLEEAAGGAEGFHHQYPQYPCPRLYTLVA
jgi:hypothetical protein